MYMHIFKLCVYIYIHIYACLELEADSLTVTVLLPSHYREFKEKADNKRPCLKMEIALKIRLSLRTCNRDY